MAFTIHATTGQNAYHEVVESVRRHGRRRQSRNGLTLSLDDVTVVLESPKRALPLGCGRELSTRIAAAEALQLIGAFSDPEWLVNLAPQFKTYREPTGEFHGAYGVRVGEQIAAVVAKLRADEYTRQAVVTLWNPRLDNDPDKLDYPCTVAFGFNLAGPTMNTLNMRVTMRSNDVWLGLPYDFFQFAQLQLTICRIMGFDPGTYVHTAWSMHLYDVNVENTYKLHDWRFDVTEAEQPTGIGRYSDEFPTAISRARAIAYGLPLDGELTDSEEWFRAALR